MIYQRRHTRLIDEMGGLFEVMPVWTSVLFIAVLGSIGLPGTNGFVGEFLILLGTFKTHPTAAVLATFGIVLAAVYMLWMMQRVVFGRITREENRRLVDLSWREHVVLVPLVILIIPRTAASRVWLCLASLLIIGGVFLMRYSVVFIGFDVPLS